MTEANHLADALEGLFTAPDFDPFGFWFVTYPAAVEGLTSQ